MVSKIPKNFQTAQDTILSVSLQDIVQQRGYFTLYGLKNTDATFSLTSNIVGSSYQLEPSGTNVSYLHNAGIGTTSNATAVDFDFDLVVEGKPIIAEGDVLIQLPLFLERLSGTGEVSTALTIKVIHYDGSTETTLSTTTKTISTTNLGGGGQSQALVSINPNISRQVWKRGETIRLNFVATATQANSQLILGHDPLNRDGDLNPLIGGTKNTQLILNLPVVLENI
jgi:hypothetical protein